MPELPEVETVCRGLQQSVQGDVIADVVLRRPDIRIPIPPELPTRLTGEKLEKIERRAKYLLWHFTGNEVALLHLGMSGRIKVLPAWPNDYAAHDHVIFRFQSGKAAVFHDPRRFGLVTHAPADDLALHPLLAHLGPEPLDEEVFTADYLYRLCQQRTQAIKPLIMNQEVVVGVGNIYACEALHRAGINPERSANKIDKKEIVELVKQIRYVLIDAISAGGSSLRDYVDSNGQAGYFQYGFSVYQREGEGCSTCKGKIQLLRQAGRATFYCPYCQK